MTKRVYEYTCSSCGGPVESSNKGKEKITGLGTWKCLHGCKKRNFTVNRRVGSGKEKDNQTQAWPVRRAIKVNKKIANADKKAA